MQTDGIVIDHHALRCGLASCVEPEAKNIAVIVDRRAVERILRHPAGTQRHGRDLHRALGLHELEEVVEVAVMVQDQSRLKTDLTHGFHQVAVCCGRGVQLVVGLLSTGSTLDPDGGGTAVGGGGIETSEQKIEALPERMVLQLHHPQIVPRQRADVNENHIKRHIIGGRFGHGNGTRCFAFKKVAQYRVRILLFAPRQGGSRGGAFAWQRLRRGSADGNCQQRAGHEHREAEPADQQQVGGSDDDQQGHDRDADESSAEFDQVGRTEVCNQITLRQDAPEGRQPGIVVEQGDAHRNRHRSSGALPSRRFQRNQQQQGKGEILKWMEANQFPPEQGELGQKIQVPATQTGQRRIVRRSAGRCWQIHIFTSAA